MAGKGTKDILLSPLLKMVKIQEDSNENLTGINTSVGVLLSNSNLGLALDIEKRDILKEISLTLKEILANPHGKAAKAPKVAGVISGAKTAGFMVFTALGVVAASSILMGVKLVSPAKLIAAIAISFALVPMTKAMIEIMQAFSPVQSLLARGVSGVMNKFKIGSPAQSMSKSKAIGMAFVVVLGAAILVTLASYVLSGIKPIGPAQIFSALFIGIAIQPMAATFIGVILAISKAGITADKEGMLKIVMGGIVMVAIIAAIAGIAKALQFLPKEFVEPPEIMWVLQTGFMMYIFSIPLVKIMKAVAGLSIKQMIFAAVALPLIALSIIGISIIFKQLAAVGAYLAPPVEWTLKSALVVLLFSFAFVRILKAITSLTIKQMIFAAAALPLVAIGIAGVAFVFQYLDKVGAYKAPPIKWTLAAGLSIITFSFAFGALALIAKAVGIGGLIKGAIAMPLVAIGILATAWVFQYLPEKTIAPDTGWSIDTALSLVIFGIPLILLGLAALPSAGLALLLGAAGMILIAGTIWVVAKIFANLDPGMEAGARAASASLFAPIDAMTDSLARMKDKIGIENMIPLAKGILAIAGAWLALSAAMVGKAIGGVVEGGLNLLKKGMDVLSFGATKTDGPFQLLDKLIARKDDLIKIGPAVLSIGRGMASISKAGWNATKALKELNNIAHRKNSVKMASLSIQRIGRSYTEIAKASKMMNVPAIEASTKMFNAIAHVAKMKGQDAMSILAKELMTSVLELSKIVDKLDKNVTKQPEGIKGAMDGVLSGFLDKIKGKTADLKGQAGEAGLIDIAPIVEAIQELEERFMRPIRVQEV